MSAVPNQFFQNVSTWVKSDLAYLYNSFVYISLANKKFQNFQNFTGNLGDTITFDLPSRSRNANGLIIQTQPYNQRTQTLTLTQALNNSAAFTAQQLVFNAEQYMERFDVNAVNELGTGIEQDLLKNFVSGVTVNNTQSPQYGQNISATYSGPFRFFGDGVTPINSYGQLAQAIAAFTDFGASNANLCGLIPLMVQPTIVNTGLQQFAMKRNDETAESWDIGNFAGCRWMTSNLLPIHYSGTIGDSDVEGGNVLTVVSTITDSTGQITGLVCTEPTGSTETKAMVIGDLIQVLDVGNYRNRFLTFIGHVPCEQPVQALVTTDADSVAGTVTFSIRTATGIGLVSQANANQNLTKAIVPGVKLQVVPSHRAGAIWSGNQIYVAMPKLPEEVPYPTSNFVDPESGASIRHYYGAQFGQNNRSYVRDCIYQGLIVPENCMRLIFPLNQG